ncbi:MAG: DNA polymerase III subunit beta [Patescibacteria group bacterium]
MKISSLQENLKNGLQITGHLSGKNINLPILNNVMIEARDGEIKLIATDLEIGIVCQIRGKIEEEGSFTVDSKIISDYISLLPNKKVDIEKKDSELLIKSENYKTSVKGMSAEDYPVIPQVERKGCYKVKISEFKKALSQVIFAVSNSETRIELTGVLFNLSNKELTLASTDSYRLAEKKIKIKTEGEIPENRSIIIPAKTLQEVTKILAIARNENFDENGGELSFYVSDNQILIIIGNTELVSRLIEGFYPDYGQIIPQKNETTIIINRAELIRAIKAASIFSKSGSNDINLDFPLGKNQAIISSTSSQSGDNMTELDATVNGVDNGIVVNYRYLLDGVNAIDSENIRIEITNSNTPCVIRGEDDKDYLYIVMPIKQ